MVGREREGMTTKELNEIADVILKALTAKKLIKNSPESEKLQNIEKDVNQYVATTEARIEILKDKIVEQSGSYDKMQNKMFSIVGLLLTLGGLITYDIFSLNFPNTVLEYIVFVAALLCLGGASALIGYDYRTKKNWSVPIGPVEEEKLNNTTTYEEALSIIHSDYRLAFQERSRSLDKKAKFLNGSFHLFVSGVILIIVLKIGG